MLTKKRLTKTNLNLKIFLTSLFLIFIFSLSISSITNAGTSEEEAIACTKACNVFQCATCDKNCNALPASCSGVPSTSATCGNNIQESGEECDQSQESAAIFGPNQCQGKGTCNQSTCKCSGGGGTTGTNPTPTGPASFSADKTSGTTPLTVNFTLTNGTGCINYMCDTGVGVDNSKYVYEKSFSCTYNTAGTYTASISCNGNKITKTITVTGSGTSTTPTPTVTPTPTPTLNSPNVKPTNYVSITKPYTRAPEDQKTFDDNGEWTGEYEKYYAFSNPIENFGYIPQFRGFIPPGTMGIYLQIIDSSDVMLLGRHNKLPTSVTPYRNNGTCALDKLIAEDCWATMANEWADIMPAVVDAFPPPDRLNISRAGWLYAQIKGSTTEKYEMQFSVRVDIKIYNAWWDKYIKDEAGWNKYIENVETYIDPTTEIQTSPTPTPTPIQTPSLTATTSNLDANFTITNGTSCINYMCDTTTKTMVASEKDFKYQESFTCHYTKAGSYTASIECPNNNIITKVVTVKNPTQSSKACQRDNPDCEKVTCNNVYCNDGCGRIKGTRVCDGS